MAASNIRIKKICQWCGVEFEAQKVSTKYCSHRCANLAYKQAVRDKRVKQAENETHYVKTEKPVENIKDKEYLSIAQAATLLGLSLQAVYKMIYAGHLVAYKLSSRLSFVKRTDIDAML
ncbi:MAG: helix-turn-helix domain-containing protein, partial [Alistipes sp.]|nr:helix-turn-helix domain-containing protein [Alistipes sp.]